MESLILKLFENSVSLAILVIILWIFLPRLLQTMDNMDRRNGKEHEAVLLVLLKIEQHMIWHEAKMSGVDAVKPDSPEGIKAANSLFNRNLKELEGLQAMIIRIFDQRSVA